MSEIIEAPAREVAEAPATLAANSPMGMMLAAYKQNIPLDQIREMMTIQREWEADEARKASNDAFAAFKAEAVEIIKRKEVDFPNSKGGRTKYKHAELSDVVGAVGPALSKHGFSWRWKVEQQAGKIKVTCYLQHRLGHQMEASMEAAPDDSGGKNSIQAIASTTTYLERHTLKAVCGLSEKGDDTDGSTVSQEDKAVIADWIQGAKEAKTISELDSIWKDGLPQIQKTNSLAMYEDFRNAVSASKKRLEKA